MKKYEEERMDGIYDRKEGLVLEMKYRFKKPL